MARGLVLIRQEAKETLWRWRELGIGILFSFLGLFWFIQSFGLLKWMGGGFVVLGLLLMFIGQQRGRFRHSEKGVGVVGFVEGQITYFGPIEGGAIAVSDITGVTLITHEGIKCWRLDQNGQDALIIPVSARGSEHLFDAFAEITGFPLERMLRQLAQKTTQSSIIWRRVDYGHDQKYLH